MCNGYAECVEQGAIYVGNQIAETVYCDNHAACLIPLQRSGSYFAGRDTRSSGTYVLRPYPVARDGSGQGRICRGREKLSLMLASPQLSAMFQRA